MEWAMAMGVAVMGFCCQHMASAGLSCPDTGSVVLVLEDGQAPRETGQRESRDMELEFILKGGRWQREVWGYAVWLARADHDGQLMKVEENGRTTKLDVKLKINADYWSKPGSAEYRLEVRRDGGRISGMYTGRCKGVEVKGRVSGAIYPLWHEPVAGFKPLAAGEHPRLVFRKSDLPGIKRRLNTPEGRAIEGRFFMLLKQPVKGAAPSGKLTSYHSAGMGLAYQLTGNREYADTARRFMEERVLPLRDTALSQDIHYGPFALGASITLDFCYDAWEPAFRTRVIQWVAAMARNLTEGTIHGKVMSGYNPNPWSNHNGIRAASAGMAALAVLGEKDGSGKPLEGIERMVWLAARDARRHMATAQGATGWCLEGEFYKRMTYNAGPGHFIHAYRTAMGGDLLAGWPGAYTILGEWMESLDRSGSLSAGSGQTAGIWPTCLCTVPAEYLPALRWLYDRTFGLRGDRSFGFEWPFHAGYVLAAFPFEVEARVPGEVLPWAVPDLRHGRHLFRWRWKASDDFLTIVHLRSEICRASWSIERSGDTGELKVSGLGRNWVNGVSLPGVGVANKVMGGKTTYFQATGDGAATFGARLDDYYWEEIPKAEELPDSEELRRKGAELVFVPRWEGKFIDRGIRVERHMALDYSALSGAPALLVILDRITRGPAQSWSLKLAEGAAARVEGNTFMVGDASGANMRGTFVVPNDVKITGSITAGGADEYFVILTIQNGPPPAVAVAGNGTKARVSVGRRTIWFDGQKLVLGK